MIYCFKSARIMKKFESIIIAILLCFSNSNLVFSQEEIKLQKEQSGVYTVPCEVNGLRLRFVLDTGASTVCISLTEASFMYKNGYLEDGDFLGTAKTKIASGEVEENYVVNLKQIKIGTKVIKNIQAVVSKGLSAPLLLGQSVISQLGEWSIRGNYLVLHDRSGNDFSKYTEADWKQRIIETENTPAEWDADLKHLMPGVIANDHNTILKAGYVLQYTQDSTPKDEEFVLNKLKELELKGDKEAIFALGTFYRCKAKNVDDINKSLVFFNKLIDGKMVFHSKLFSVYETPYLNMYLIYENHLRNFEKAANILQQGALLNDADCIIFLMESYYDKKQYQNLFQWANKLSQACSGYSKTRALYWKAKCLMEGYGTNKNISQGVQHLRQIVDKFNINDEEALKDLCNYYVAKSDYNSVKEYAGKIRFEKFYHNYYLGFAYFFLKDYASARLYFKHLWDKDKGMYEPYKFGFASCLLGQCYENGLGGTINYKDAERCYMYAYEKCDFFGALGYLGDMYSNDKIYQNPNYEAAFGCYLQGAKNEDGYCCYMVSQYYKYGIGTEENSKESNFWLQKAKENGWKE